MRKYLIDPKQKWVKANLHCHTNLSDGFFTPKEIKKLYMEKGYGIVAFSDHELFYEHSDLTDENFVALNSAEYSFSRFDGKCTYEFYREQGSEVNGRDADTVHINIFKPDSKDNEQFCSHPSNFLWATDINKDPILDRRGEPLKYDGYKRELTLESINYVINEANKRGCLVQYNHPNWSLNSRDLYINLEGLWSLEIYNYATELETSAEYCPYIYDDMLRSGKRLFCSNGDDNHNHNGSLEGSFGGFNYVGVNNLTYDEVFKSLKTGNFYASMGPEIKSLYIDMDEGKIYVECSPAEDIVLVGCNRTFRHYYGDNLTKADFKIFGGEFYFRIAIKDKEGRWANTSAYFLKDYGFESH